MYYITYSWGRNFNEKTKAGPFQDRQMAESFAVSVASKMQLLECKITDEADDGENI